MVNEVVLKRDFDNLKQVLEERIWINKQANAQDVNESGINMDINQRRVIIRMGSKSAHSASKGSCDKITVNCYVDAGGGVLPLMIIFRKYFHISYWC